MTFSVDEYIQGLLFEIEQFHNDLPGIQSFDDKVKRFATLFRLADAVDVAVRGFSEYLVQEVTGVPAWMVVDTEHPDRGLAGLVNRLGDRDQLGEVLEYAEDFLEESDCLGQFEDLLRALKGSLARSTPVLAASSGTRVAEPMGTGSFMVPFVAGGQQRGALLRMTPTRVAAGSIRIRHADMDPIVREHVTGSLRRHGLDRLPWQVSFVQGVEVGVRAADELLTSLKARPRPVQDFEVSGIFESPDVIGESVGVTVALARLADTLPAYLRGPGQLVATGVIKPAANEFFIDSMPDSIVAAKLSAVQEIRNGIPERDGRFSWLLAPSEQPRAGVRAIRACEHGGRPTLADAARAQWGARWDSFVDGVMENGLRDADLQAVSERSSPLCLSDGVFICDSESQQKIVDHFTKVVDGQAAEASRPSWGVLGDQGGTGRSWIVFGAAEQLEAEGWHILKLRVSSSEGNLPEPYEVVELAKLQLPRGCTRCLITIDDVSAAEDIDNPETIPDFASVINDAGFHLLLVLDSRAKDWSEGEGWDTSRAPFTVHGLSDAERREIVQRAAERTHVRPGMVEGRTLLANFRWIALHSPDNVLLDRDVLNVDPSNAPLTTAYAVSAALSLIGVRPDRLFLREHVADETLVTHLRDLAVFEANDILEQAIIEGRSSARQAAAKAYQQYLEWLLTRKRLSDAATIINRLRREGNSFALNRLLGRSRQGQLDWSLVDSALNSTDYSGVAHLVNALQQSGAMRSRRAVLAEKLALAIAGAADEDLRARSLSWSLNILWQNRSAVTPNLWKEVRESLGPMRISIALSKTTRIEGRWRLVREIGHLFAYAIYDDARRDLLNVIERCHHDLFFTTCPSQARELSAALLLHNEIEKVRGVVRPVEHLAEDHAWINDLIGQRPDSTWSLGARFALAALQAKFAAPVPDVEELAALITNPDSKWTIFELNMALAYLKASNPRLAENVTYTALRRGLGNRLRVQLPAAPPVIAAEMLFFLLRMAPAEVTELHYQLKAEGNLPNPEEVTKLVDQITRFPDYKGVGRLFYALAAEQRELPDLTSESMGQAVVDSLSPEYFLIALRAPRRSVALHLISAILANGVVLDSSLADSFVDEVLAMIEGGKVQSAVVAGILVELLEAEHRGQLALSDGRELADFLCDAIEVETLDAQMINASDEVLLNLLSRLAMHIENRRGTDQDEWAATRYARAFRLPGEGFVCMLCAATRSSDPLKVISLAAQIEAILRRGSYEAANEAAKAVLLHHWSNCISVGQANLRIRNPGQLSRIFDIAASLGVPEILKRISDKHIASLLIDATPVEAGEIVAGLRRLDPVRAVQFRDSMTDRETSRVLDGLLLPEHLLRGRARAFRYFESGGWSADAPTASRLREEVERAATTTLSMPLMAESLRLLARFDRDHAVSIARKHTSRNVPRAYVARGRERDERVTLVGVLQALYARESATAVLQDFVERGELEYLSPRHLGFALDRAKDLLKHSTQVACLHFAEGVLARIASNAGLHGELQLRAIGEIANRIADWDGGAPVVLDGVPSSLKGREDSADVLWSLAFIDVGDHTRLWESAMDRIPAADARLDPNRACRMLVSLLHRDQVGRIEDKVLSSLIHQASFASSTYHRMLRAEIVGSILTVEHGPLAAHAVVWAESANAYTRRAHPDRRHTATIATWARDLSRGRSLGEVVTR